MVVKTDGVHVSQLQFATTQVDRSSVESDPSQY